MANTGEKPLGIPYKYVRLVGTREALNVFFQNAEIDLASEIQGIGRELLQAVEVAIRIDMPLVLNFQGVQRISSALVGKLVLLNKKTKAEGMKLEFREMSDAVRTVIQKVMWPTDSD
ncbi:MAG: anti-sigma factor antagonist [Pirellulaceae bacterium]|jgi:anti-anti-sigma regulatory factor|nr:anti-anti-sigma factor [Planctomycetaceae bacterium]MDP6466723.1 anti-sigma factor antagonist [Pirellulaceae bacterium]MDP6554044.1 anti-sigma factor antagonist [Pirellulaceae bacterium]